MPIRSAGVLMAIAVLLPSVVGAADSERYPVKPVRLIFAYAAGGGTDVVGRVIAQKLGEGLGRNVIVDNRPGANVSGSSPEEFGEFMHRETVKWGRVVKLSRMKAD